MSDFSKIISKGKKNLEKGFEKKKEYLNEKKRVFDLKKQLKAKNNELKELYTDYGKSCYDGTPDNNIEKAIEDILEEIIDLEVAIKETEGVKEDSIFCSRCGNICESDFFYCSKCGKKLN